MAMIIYPIQMLQMVLAGFSLVLLIFPLPTSTTSITTSKDEIKCDSCTVPVVDVASPPPPVVIIDHCPPPPSPPSPPPPPAPPACPACQIPISCNLCPPPCPGCPPPPCNVCQMPSTSGSGSGGVVYPPPNDVYPYFPPPSFHSAASSNSELINKLFILSISFLLLSPTFCFF